MEAQAIRISAEDLTDARVRAAVAPLLERACEHSGGRFAPEHVVYGLAEGFFQLWGVVRGHELLCCCVTTLHTYPTGLKTVEVMLLGGDPRSFDETIYQFIKTLTAFGAENECDRVEFAGRDGFARRVDGVRTIGRLYEADI